MEEFTLNSICQKKTHSKWGLKMWARCGPSGICYDFDVYTGQTKGYYGDQSGYALGLGAGVIIQLCDTLKTPEKTTIFADNFFSGIPLVSELTKKGIGYIGTLRENRLMKCKLKNEKEMKKEGRGSIDYSVASLENSDIT